MIERRRFLKMVGACAAFGPVALGCGAGSTQQGSTDGGGGVDSGSGGGGGVDSGNDPPLPDAGFEKGNVTVGNVNDLPRDTVLRVPNAPLILGRDARGVYAMTSLCTHRGCDMRLGGNIGPTVVVCNCHGAVFDANGSVTRGPAGSPLSHFAVGIDSDGTLSVAQNTVVPADTRLPVL